MNIDHHKNEVRSTWMPELTGLRGLSILLVLVGHISFFHLYLPGSRYILQLGALGVDCFFVLSGYLITGILVSSKQSRSYFFHFYARRILRIFPIYFTLLFVLFYILPHFDFLQFRYLHNLFRTEKVWFFTLFANWLTSFNQIPVLYFGHLWSLFVEEQFYLIWPFMIYFLNKKQLFPFMGTMIIFFLAVRFHFDEQLVQPFTKYTIYCSTYTRLDTIIFGSLVYFLSQDKKFSIFFTNPTFKKFIPTILFILATSYLICCDEKSSFYFLSFSLSALFFSTYLLFILLNPKNNLLDFLKNKFLIYLGTISYGLYLVHWPIFCLFNIDLSALLSPFQNPTLNAIVVSGLGLLLSLALSSLSWHFFEKPILSLKTKFPLLRE